MTNRDPRDRYTGQSQWTSQPQRQPQPQRRSYENQPRDYKDVDALPSPDIAYPRTETRTQADAATDTDAKLAGLGKRVGAFAIDFGVGLGVSYVAQGVASMFGAGGEAVAIMGYGGFFGAWLANRAYGQSRTGQSIGKWALNMKTIDTQTDEPPSLIRSVAREGVSALAIATEALVVPGIADGLLAVFDKEKRQTLHDRAVGTKVIDCTEGYKLDEKLADALEDGEASELVEDIKGAFGDLVSQASEDESLRNAGRNAQQMGKRAGKQMRNWVENVQDKLDNL